MPDTKYISQLTLLDGETYKIKDAEAREAIAALESYTDFVGVTTSNIEDGSTTNPITVNGESVTVRAGSICTKGSKEFIFNGTAWQEFGDLSALGALAYKDSAEATYTPAGTVSQPTFTGSSLTATGSYTPEGSVSLGAYTPAGTVSQPTFSGDSLESTGTFTPSGSITISKAATGTANYTPEGTVSQPNFTGTQGSVSVSGTPEGTIGVGSGAANYTPAGTVSAPTVTVTPATGSVTGIASVGTLPAFSATVDNNETLVFSWNAGTLPTADAAATTVVTGITSAEATQPTFTGTGVDLTFTGSSLTATGNFTPEGTVSQPTFTGAGALLEGEFSGTAGNVSVTGTPSGTVSQPTFTGTAADLSGTFTGTAATISVTGTPEGTVSQPTFTGTEATITAS